MSAFTEGLTPFIVWFGALALLVILHWPSAPRRKRTEPAPEPSTDWNVKTVYGMRLPEWDALTPEQRAEKRLNVAHYLNQENR